MSGILVVDDRREALSEALCLAVAELGHRLTHVRGIGEAGDLIDTDAFSMVVCDLGTVGGDTRAFVRALRRRGRLGPVLILAADVEAALWREMTADPEGDRGRADETVERGRGAGAHVRR